MHFSVNYSGSRARSDALQHGRWHDSDTIVLMLASATTASITLHLD